MNIFGFNLYQCQLDWEKVNATFEELNKVLYFTTNYTDSM